MRFPFQCLQIQFYWHEARSCHWMSPVALMPRRPVNSPNWGHVACNNWNTEVMWLATSRNLRSCGLQHLEYLLSGPWWKMFPDLCFISAWKVCLDLTLPQFLQPQKFFNSEYLWRCLQFLRNECLDCAEGQAYLVQAIADFIHPFCCPVSEGRHFLSVTKICKALGTLR